MVPLAGYPYNKIETLDTKAAVQFLFHLQIANITAGYQSRIKQATLVEKPKRQMKKQSSCRSCGVKVEVAVLGFPSLVGCMVSVEAIFE